MRMLDLFSGIGGFALAAQWVWGDNLEIVSFCEIDPFCQKVLKKHWPDVPICEDIRKLDYGWITANAKSARSTGIQETRNHRELLNPGDGDTGLPQKKIDLLTGGFPCQPFSAAGLRKGKEDDRFLWPEMFRVISEFRPTWIIGENVAGIINMAQYEDDPEVDIEADLFGDETRKETYTGRGILHGIISELEHIGYSVQPFVIPACSLNAPHRRDRVWIVAENTDCKRGSRGSEDGRQVLGSGCSEDKTAGPDCETGDASNSNSEGMERYFFKSREIGWAVQKTRIAGSRAYDWSRPWLEVATELCGVDVGLPAELDGLKLSKSKHRQERLKSLGNSIVPQVAEVIFRAIKEIGQ